MIKEFLNVRKYVGMKWQYFAAGMVFMVLSAVLNGISLSSIVPMLDIIIAGRKIMLPSKLPVFVYSRLEPLISVLNSIAPVVMLKYLIVFVIVMIFLKGLFFYLNNYYFHFFGNRILTDLRNRIYSKITYLSMDFFSHGQSGNITSHIIYDVNLLMRSFVVNIPALIFQSTLAIVYFFIIFMIDWKMSLFSLLIFPPLLLPVINIGKKLRKLGKKVQEKYGVIGNLIHEGIYGQQIIKAYNREKSIIEEFESENENIFRTVMSSSMRILLISPFTEIVAVVGASGIIYYGASKVIEGSISSGFLFLFFIALFSIISPIKDVAKAYANLKHESSALHRIFGILDKESSVKDEGKEVFPGLKEKIEFKEVSFAYGKKEIFSNINLSVRKGEKLGIVGYTGAGKTTLAGLLLRFYDPVSGQILIDGKDIREFTLESLRGKTGFVTQEPIIFCDTIEKNITLSEKTDPQRLENALNISGLKKLVEALPEGCLTTAGERGTTLSGGQKQLLSIARAVYRNPEILILDEATASLDSNSETLLQQALGNIIEGRTVFIIAHRLSTLRNTDRIIVLMNGRISEMGTHQQLFDMRGDYYKLWQLQFSA
ncbi:MAG TPA: ABC transporter ATP-binding protein [bacterium]|nr:ABC transporter ATP-binding protein [bacterium]